MPIHAFDQAETLLGQASLAHEMETDHPGAATVLVAVGGGGLIGGIAAGYQGRIKIIAVESDGAPTLKVAFAAGGPAEAPVGGIAADSLAPRRVGELVYPIARAFVSPDVALVSDDDIRNAQALLWEKLRLVTEPGGAAAFAALLSGAYRPEPGENVIVVVCGANTTAVNFDRGS
jgi:threonine dehydratase